MVAILTGLLFGIGLAFFFDYMDRSVKSTEEMSQASGVPSIGLIPAYRSARSWIESHPQHQEGWRSWIWNRVDLTRKFAVGDLRGVS